MKLILTHEVPGLGDPGDVVEVKDGYGRNYLVPQGKATGWTRGAEKQIAQIKRARQARVIHDVETAEAVKAQLEANAVRIPARAGSGGRLFGAVTVTDVVDAISAAGGPAIDKRTVQITAPIKSVGDHTVTVRLHAETVATVPVQVVAE